ITARSDALQEANKIGFQVHLVVRRRDTVDAGSTVFAGQPISLHHPIQIDDVVERAQRRPPFRSRRIGYPLSVRGQVCGVQSPLPCFRSTALYSVTPPFPRSGPGEAGSPTSSVLRRRYDFPPARTRSLIVSVPGPTRASCIRVRRSAPDEPGGSSSGPEHLISRCPNTRH